MIHVMGIDNLFTLKNINELLDKAQKIFLSKRLIQNIPQKYKSKISPLVPLDETIDYLQNNENEQVIVITSGDPLFFGIGKKLLKILPKERLCFYPGLTTVQRACAKFKITWDDMDIISLHGREHTNITQKIAAHIHSRNGYIKIGIFTDNKNSPDKICSEIRKLNLNNLQILVAEDIGGKNEAFWKLDLFEATQRKFHPLNFLIITGKVNKPIHAPGIKEDLFHHQKGLITKTEIRVNIISRLELPSKGVLWDIGAGSGSISIEASLLRPNLDIYAIEKNFKRIKDIEDNIKRFLTPNITVKNKKAPEGLFELPTPDRIFIGGGIKDKELLAASFKLLKKGGLIVVSTILISSLNSVLSFCKKHKLNFEATQITLSPIKELGNNFIINPKPPITIITIWKD